MPNVNRDKSAIADATVQRTVAHPFLPTANQVKDGKMKTLPAQPPSGLFDK
ncbi:MAG: hypothetical protein LBL62_11110 [Planctomycetaceae bacterium]|nr:hypothetical protein [Planctomycetaceae bacterium]